MIRFKLITTKDLEQLCAWLQLQHIREFWDDGDRTIEQVRCHYFQKDQVKRYIIFIDEQAVAYIQAYVIDAKHEYKEFIVLNESTMGIDYFIGNNSFLGRGFSIPILRDFIKFYCPVSRILVDPIPENQKAIHIYKKFGFIKIGIHVINNQLHDMMVYSKQ
jgi:RimJ/RimL family protein N-acetyltransferase